MLLHAEVLPVSSIAKDGLGFVAAQCRRQLDIATLPILHVEILTGQHVWQQVHWAVGSTEHPVDNGFCGVVP